MKKILFFGDSITDMGRVRDVDHVMKYGMGYVFLTATRIEAKFPGKYEIINKGISGNKLFELVDRYETDVLTHNPDVLTILIGVNDVWHRLDNSYSGAYKPSKFIKEMEALILRIKKDLPNCRVILMEPFITHGVQTDQLHNYDLFSEIFVYARKIKSLAKKYQIPFVKLQKKLAEANEIYGDKCLYDGVHPNVIGASIISKEWIKTFTKLKI